MQAIKKITVSASQTEVNILTKAIQILDDLYCGMDEDDVKSLTALWDCEFISIINDLNCLLEDVIINDNN